MSISGRSLQSRAVTAFALLTELGSLVLGTRMLATPCAGLGASDGSSQLPAFRTTATLVVVEAIVRDTLGRPVSGLTADDFEVRENGRRQVLTSFQEVGRRGSPNTESTRSDVERQLAGGQAHTTSQTALVFEQLGPEARRLARLGALAFIDRAHSGRQVGVFSLDRGLHELAPYTTDPARLREAVERAFGYAGRPLERTGRVPGAESGTAAPETSAATKTDNPYIRAHATLDGLSAVIETLRPHAGRKTIVLFSEGLAFGADQDTGQIVVRSPHRDDTWLTDNRHDHFTRVIETANGARVSFYTFDAAGLRAHEPPIGFGEAPYVGLSALANETGGRFIESTNDLAPGLARLAVDLEHYYLLGYEPANTRHDGSYRRIDVRVHRSDVSVLARRGYRAPKDRR